MGCSDFVIVSVGVAGGVCLASVEARVVAGGICTVARFVDVNGVKDNVSVFATFVIIVVLVMSVFMVR